jgi:hypothetical protein
MGYPPQPQFIYVPVPQQPGQPMQPGGVQVISTAEEARKLYKEKKKEERKLRKEWDEAAKKKEGDKKPDKKLKIDEAFATKMEVVFFMCLIALPIGFAEAFLVRFLLARLV